MSHFRFFLGRDDVPLLFVCHSVVGKSVCLIFSHYSNAVRSCCNMSLACWLVIGLKILMRLQLSAWLLLDPRMQKRVAWVLAFYLSNCLHNRCFNIKSY